MKELISINATSDFAAYLLLRLIMGIQLEQFLALDDLRRQPRLRVFYKSCCRRRHCSFCNFAYSALRPLFRMGMSGSTSSHTRVTAAVPLPVPRLEGIRTKSFVSSQRS